jgi:hypothetical protein
MAQFPGKTTGSIKETTIGYDTASQAGSQCNNKEVLHSAGVTKKHLSDSCGVGVIGNDYGKIVMPLN